MRPPLLLTLVLLACALVACAAAPAAAAPWRRPVPGPVIRPFAYDGMPFAAGRHRGADLRARRGDVVRSACAGRVRFAGGLPGRGAALTVACGSWRVTYLGLGTLRVRAGDRVAAGQAVGTVGRPRRGERSHLHVGVRRAGAARAYVDPLRFLEPRGAAPPPAIPAPEVRPEPPTPRPEPPTPRPVPQPRSRPLPPTASWAVWAGLALTALGAWPATALVARRRARRAPAPAAILDA